VLLGRLLTGETVGSGGHVAALRGEDRPAAGAGINDVVWRFTRSKFAPVIGMAMDIGAGEDFLGNPVTPKSVALDLVTPLSLQDIKAAYRELSIPMATASSLASLIGMGLTVHDKGELSEFRNNLQRLTTDDFKGTPEARRARRTAGLLTDLKKLAKKQEDSGQSSTKTELYAVGTARWALGRKEIARYPNPVPAVDDLPSDIKEVVMGHLALAAYAASGIADWAGAEQESRDEAIAAAEYLVELDINPLDVLPYLSQRLRKQGIGLDRIRKRNMRLGYALLQAKKSLAARKKSP
jgi:hypothetical protein